MKRFYTAALLTLMTVTGLAVAKPAQADSIQSYCEYVPNGVSQPEAAMPCVFSQHQGFVYITWEDGVTNEFEPVGDDPGNYVDQRGGLVYRRVSERNADSSYLMAQGTIHVYWGR